MGKELTEHRFLNSGVDCPDSFVSNRFPEFSRCRVLFYEVSELLGVANGLRLAQNESE